MPDQPTAVPGPCLPTSIVIDGVCYNIPQEPPPGNGQPLLHAIPAYPLPPPVPPARVPPQGSQFIPPSASPPPASPGPGYAPGYAAPAPPAPEYHFEPVTPKSGRSKGGTGGLGTFLLVGAAVYVGAKLLGSK